MAAKDPEKIRQTTAAAKAAATQSENSSDDVAKASSSKPPKTSAGVVQAKLKARWASGGRAHESGETVTMTRGTYERLKAFDRVE